jgi:hypothetical protein
MSRLLIAIFSAFFILVTPVYPDTLSDDEVTDVLFMIEEEKLAHDVYLTFQRKYRERVFVNIRDSERRHQDAMAGLVDRYGLVDPRLAGVGKFRDQSLQALYDTLIARGMQNRIEAIKVGALIEETDMRDIMLAIERTDEWPIRRVYSNLLAGSKNHLRAFVGRLERLGVTYEPEILSQAEYDAIIGG